MKYFWLVIYYGFARFLPSTHSRFGGRIGGFFRLLCARHLFKKCASTANIERMASFGDGHGIELGHRSDIGIYCHVPNDIFIGDDVMMGPHCFVTDNRTHNFDRTDIPMIEQGSCAIVKRTCIGDDVWIGRQVLILCGKKIKSHSIIGAGSVVSKDVDEYVIAAGNPIHVIRDRRLK